ncbi:MAG: helix-turn-helix transcriptional regulator [Leptospira sp.]|nr:helix-turn-helix transcriptional regulator [Leptospira sp.]
MNSLLIWKDFAVYAGPSFSTHRHSHFFHQICLGIDGPFQLKGKDEKLYSYQSAYIPSGTSHETIGTDTNFIILLVDPLSFGLNLFSEVSVIDGEPACDVSLFFTHSEIDKYYNIYLNEPEYFRSKLITQLSKIGLGNDFSTDKRILDSIEKLYLSSDRLTLTELAKRANISTSRFRHLFKEQIGIPLSAYQLWLKTRKAILYLVENQKLIEAAYEGGFSDQAHFSRIFRRSFGLNPSEFQKNKSFTIKIFKE